MRLFIALPVDHNAGETLRPVSRALARTPDVYTPVRIDQFHITLFFFGACPPAAAQAIRKAFDDCPIPAAPLPYTLAGLGAFPAIARAQVLWCGIHARTGELASLHSQIQNLAKQCGFEPEKRAFSPHLTLGRIKKGKRITPEISALFDENRLTEFSLASFTRIVLFASELTKTGPIYTEIENRSFT